jgi:dUTP pyrophosphatase
MTEDQWRWANEYDARNRKLNDGGDSMKLNVKIKKLHSDAVIPQYAHEGDAGFDLVAIEDTIIEPGETKIIRTGLAFAIPPGYEIQIRPRSGITLKTKLRVQLGTIDSGYRGEIGVIVDNISQLETDYEEKYEYNRDDELEFWGTEVYVQSDYRVLGIDGNIVETDGEYPIGTYIIRKGDRIAQAVIAPVEQAHFQVVDELDETTRGTGGFGSSGVKSKLDELLSKITPENRHEEIDM